MSTLLRAILEAFTALATWLFAKSLTCFPVSVWINEEAKTRRIEEELEQALQTSTTTLLVLFFDDQVTVWKERLNNLGLHFAVASRAMPPEAFTGGSDKLLLVPYDELDLETYKITVPADKSNEELLVIVPELHPLPTKNAKVLAFANSLSCAASGQSHISFESPYMRALGGDRTLGMMKRLGLRENEQIEHAMVSKSIEKAGKRFARKVRNERRAGSIQEWFDLNLPRTRPSPPLR